MTFAARIRQAAMVATLGACALAVPGLAETQRDVTPPPLLPTPPLPEPIPMPPPPRPQAPLPAGAIGTAEMDAAGNILLHLRAPERPTSGTWAPVVPSFAPQERMGYGEIVIDRLNPHYQELLQHLAGLEPGHEAVVRAWRAGEEWHCAFDPDRGPCPGLHLLPNGIAMR